MFPTEFLVKARQQELDREIEQILLVRKVTNKITNQLEKYGKKVLKDNGKAQPSKN